MKDRRIITESTGRLLMEIMIMSLVMVIFGAGGVYIYSNSGIGYIIGIATAVMTILLVKINSTLESIRDGVLETYEEEEVK